MQKLQEAMHANKSFEKVAASTQKRDTSNSRERDSIPRATT